MTDDEIWTPLPCCYIVSYGEVRICLQYPKCHPFLDLVLAGSSGGGGSSARPAKRKKVYSDHKTYSELMAGMKDGRYHQVKRRRRGGEGSGEVLSQTLYFLDSLFPWTPCGCSADI